MYSLHERIQSKINSKSINIKDSIIEDVSQTLIKRINNFQYIYFL